MGFSCKGEKLKGLMRGSESVTGCNHRSKWKMSENTKLKKVIIQEVFFFFFLTIYIGELKRGRRESAGLEQGKKIGI